MARPIAAALACIAAAFGPAPGSAFALSIDSTFNFVNNRSGLRCSFGFRRLHHPFGGPDGGHGGPGSDHTFPHLFPAYTFSRSVCEIYSL